MTAAAGSRYKVVTGIPGKTGLVYTLDAATGKFGRARRWSRTSSSTSTGRAAKSS